MPYTVTNLIDLYDKDDEDGESRLRSEAIEAYLNRSEDDGWALVGVVGDHPMWDDNGEQNGQVGAMLILHMPNQGTTVSLDGIKAKVAARTGTAS